MSQNYFIYILCCALCCGACGLGGNDNQEQDDGKGPQVAGKLETPNGASKNRGADSLTEEQCFDWENKNKNCTTKQDWITKFEKMADEKDDKNPNDTKIKKRQIEIILTKLKDTPNAINEGIYTSQKKSIQAAKDSINTRYITTIGVIDELLKCFIYQKDTATTTPNEGKDAQALADMKKKLTETEGKLKKVQEELSEAKETPYSTYLFYAALVALFAFLFYKWQAVVDKNKKLRKALDEARQQSTKEPQPMRTTYYEEPKTSQETHQERKKREKVAQDAAAAQRKQEAEDQRQQQQKQQQAEDDRKREANRIAALPPPIIRTLYFSTPQSDGFFRAEQATDQYIQTQTMYKLELISSTKGELSFVSDASSIYNALNHRENCILPVCKELNARDVRATKIETVKKGIAHSEGDRWTVADADRAQIKYVV